jgi:hypothetical protein
MTPQEKRKADVQLILEEQSLVVRRVVDVFNDLFHSDTNAGFNLRWLMKQMIEAERHYLRGNKPFADSHGASLSNYIRDVLRAEVAAVIREEAQKLAEDMGKRTKELAKLEKKTWRIK